MYVTKTTRDYTHHLSQFLREISIECYVHPNDNSIGENWKNKEENTECSTVLRTRDDRDDAMNDVKCFRWIQMNYT